VTSKVRNALGSDVIEHEAAAAYDPVAAWLDLWYHDQQENRMIETIEATFDGSVFRPDGPVQLRPQTRVRLRVEAETNGATGPLLVPVVAPEKKLGAPGSALRAMREANLTGPPDWSENIDKYLYGEGSRGDEGSIP
jgi:hypothetical protein